MAADHTKVLNIAGSTPIATGAYSQLVAATPLPTSQIIIANGTDTTIILAMGTAGSEVDYIAVAKGCTLNVNIPLNQMPKGTRLAVLAAGAASTSGEYSVSLIP